MITNFEIDEFFSFYLDEVEELINNTLKNYKRPDKEKYRVFNKKSLKILVDVLSEYYLDKQITTEQVLDWIYYRYGKKGIKQLVHYRILLKYKKQKPQLFLTKRQNE